MPRKVSPMSPNDVRPVVAPSAKARRPCLAASEPGSVSPPTCGVALYPLRTRRIGKKGVYKLKIYVGNLSFDTNDEDLSREFSVFGEVASATVVMDRETGRSRGFGFVDMPSDDEAKAAIEGLNAKDLQGRTLNVNESRPREGGSGGGNRGGGGYGGNRGGGGGYGGGGNTRW